MKRLFNLLVFLVITSAVNAQSNSKFTQPSKPQIDSTAIANWYKVGGKCSISSNGKYFLYSIQNQPLGSQTLFVQSIDNSWQYKFVGVNENGAFFSQDSKYAVISDKDSFYFLHLETKKINSIGGVKSYKVPQLNSRWLAYKSQNGEQLVLFDLVTAKERRYSNVLNYIFDAKANVMLLYTEQSEGNNFVQTLKWVNLSDSIENNIWSANTTSSSKVNVSNFTFDQSSSQLAFTISEGQSISIWYYKAGDHVAIRKISDQSPGIDSGLFVKGSPKFSYNGKWLFFELQTKPKTISTPRKDAVMVDIWSYKDVTIQPEQIRTLGEPNKGIICVVGINDNTVLRIEHQDEEMKTRPELITGDHVILQDQCSVKEYWWQLNPQPSFYIINLRNGAKKILKKNGSNLDYYFSFSPTGRYVTYWDWEKDFYCYDTKTQTTINISKSIPASIAKEYIRSVIPPPVAQVAAWFKDESSIIIYDNYDIWKVDPTGKKAPYNLTHGYGIKNKVKLRFLYDNNKVVDGKQSLLLIGFNTENKHNGFYRINLNENRSPEPLYNGPYTFYRLASQKPHWTAFSNGMEPIKATEDNVWIVLRQSPTDAPNYYTTRDFKNFSRLTNIQPQKNYNWLTAELITWKMFDGRMSQGVLYKPENFDSSKKYPIIFTYYEALSHRMFEFPPLHYSVADINIAWFVSRGYLVFTPDIYFKPANTSNKTVGEWAYNSVISAAQHLKKFKYVDGKKMGINGHSFGGLETAYLTTHTNIFSAAAEAAGSTDPISAYLTLVPFVSSIEHFRKQTGIERDHELYGAHPWQRPDLYRRNSSVLAADKVSTPLLIMHNMKDNQVQWRQGVELYMALRRLHKKVWMLQYDRGDHSLDGKEAEDYTIRLTQFFNHYLKNEPAPIWMTEGITAELKGVEKGYKLDIKKQP